MNKKLIISFGLFAVLAAATVLINFNKSAEAAFMGSGLPGGSTNQTLRYSNGTWGPSSVITNDGTNAFMSGNLTVNGASVTANSFIYSDARLKENITPLSNSLEKIQKMNGVSFDWKKNGAHDIGVIAQNIEAVTPELVYTDENGIKSVKYANMVALLIEAVKEQQLEIDSLKAEINLLKK
ncbi:MAG: tail fiber domain-containing protein [Patescibacteria group bacterium]